MKRDLALSIAGHMVLSLLFAGGVHFWPNRQTPQENLSLSVSLDLDSFSQDQADTQDPAGGAGQAQVVETAPVSDKVVVQKGLVKAAPVKPVIPEKVEKVPTPAPVKPQQPQSTEDLFQKELSQSLDVAPPQPKKPPLEPVKPKENKQNADLDQIVQGLDQQDPSKKSGASTVLPVENQATSVVKEQGTQKTPLTENGADQRTSSSTQGEILPAAPLKKPVDVAQAARARQASQAQKATEKTTENASSQTDSAPEKQSDEKTTDPFDQALASASGTTKQTEAQQKTETKGAGQEGAAKGDTGKGAGQLSSKRYKQASGLLNAHLNRCLSVADDYRAFEVSVKFSVDIDSSGKLINARAVDSVQSGSVEEQRQKTLIKEAGLRSIPSCPPLPDEFVNGRFKNFPRNNITYDFQPGGL